MKRYLFLFFLAVTLGWSCNKEDQAETDRNRIVQYLADNNLTAIEDDTGLFYIIEVPGGAEKPVLSDRVTVGYKGYLTNKTVFDQTAANQPVVFFLDQVIVGWQIGIPKFGRGGSGILLVPSRLGYGDRRVGSIPANSVLIFEVDLINF